MKNGIVWNFSEPPPEGFSLSEDGILRGIMPDSDSVTVRIVARDDMRYPPPDGFKCWGDLDGGRPK